MPTPLPRRFLAVLAVSFVVGALFVWLGGAFASAPKQSAGNAAATGSGRSAAKAGSCKKDADCVLVADDCCSCNEGGKQHAIGKGGKNAYEAARQKRCAGTMCPQMMSQDPSCAQHAACRAGSCALADGPAPAAGGW